MEKESRNIVSDLKRLGLVSLGALLSAVAIRIFVSTNGILPGGFTGIAVLTNRLTGDFLNINVPFALVFWALNIPPTLLVFKSVGRKFTILSMINIFLVGFLVDMMPLFWVTHDILLVVLFGGLLAGCGSVLTLRASASGGGSDFIAICFSNKYHKPFWNYVFACNAVLILISGLIYGVELALYSVVYQFVVTQVINLFHNRYKLVTLSIITAIPEEVSNAVFAVSQRGITRFDGVGMYSKNQKSMLYMVVSEVEAENIIKLVKEVDQEVFISESKSRRVVGNFYQKPFD